MRRSYHRNTIENGVYIGYTDGSTSPYNQSPVSGKTVKGVVLITDDVGICINKVEGINQKWSSNIKTKIPEVTTASNRSIALLDYAGKVNTAAVVASGLAGSAFTFATALGSEWYLPSCGEMEQIRRNEANINTALNLIGGTTLNFRSNFYWSSTQYSASDAWGWLYGESWYYFEKNVDDTNCRAVSVW